MTKLSNRHSHKPTTTILADLVVKSPIGMHNGLTSYLTIRKVSICTTEFQSIASIIWI